MTNVWILLEARHGFDSAMTGWLLELCGASASGETVTALRRDGNATAILARARFAIARPAFEHIGVRAVEIVPE